MAHVGWAAWRGPVLISHEFGPFPGSLPPNPACPLSRHRAFQRLENAQRHFGWLHCASLMVIEPFIACAPSPCGPALPVSRLGGRYPADYCGHSVAIELAFLRRSHVHTAIRTSTT